MPNILRYLCAKSRAAILGRHFIIRTNSLVLKSAMPMFKMPMKIGRILKLSVGVQVNPVIFFAFCSSKYSLKT